MRVSHGTRIKNIDDTNGYGYATVNMIDSLRRLGHEVNENAPTADVEIWFDQPHHWNFSKGPYRIGYHPWESTLLKPPGKATDGKDWVGIMNECDEVWTPSPIIAEWYRDFSGIKVPVHVYEHGVDPIWTPKERKVEDKFRFLHVGAEAARKGGTEVMKALRLAFPGDNSVELTLKIISQGWNIGRLPRIHIMNGPINLNRLISLFHEHHVYAYPSYGEGFGLTPLQAMATGMPTITVPGWAPYAEFINPHMRIGSKFWPSPWPELHPGNMLKPSIDDLVQSMRWARENYESAHADALARVKEVTAVYDWDRLTKITFDALEERLKNS